MTTPVDLLFTAIRICRYILDSAGSFFPAVLAAAATANECLDELCIDLGLHVTGQSISEGTATADKLVAIADAAIDCSLNPASSVERPVFESAIVDGIAAMLSTRSDGVKAEELTKLMLNLSWLPPFIELGDVSGVPPLPKLLSEIPDSITEPVLSVTSALHRAIGKRSEYDSGNGKLFRILAALRDGQSETLASISPSDTGDAMIQEAMLSGVSRDTLSVGLAKYQVENDDISGFLATCSRAGIENDRLIQLLPLGRLFQGAKWGRLKRWSSSIDLSICLNLYLRVVDDRKIRTYKRYAVEELSNTFGASHVEDLIGCLVTGGEHPKKIEYFGYHVCDIATLELLPGVIGSKRVMETRSALLRQISNIAGASAVAYLQEARDLQSGLQVDDGISVLEDSKVYVDEQAVLNYVNQELEADFQRYRKLVESGVGVSESIDELLKSFNSPSAKTFQIPKNDADDLLADLVGSILHRFVFDPASGLDIIVGRRIRHGTIAGELRGVLVS
ncbi:hypothetical protein V4C53_43820 [Paraburkholderia azotifigens]|uniref:hypothetical protein n=1 Tax=Paraburkholderia azotifigens TaxID=2057004 RepID=UPI00317357E2